MVFYLFELDIEILFFIFRLNLYFFMRTILSFFSISLLIFVLLGCPKTVYKHIFPTSITQSEKAFIPYKQNDTICFLDSLGNQKKFKVDVKIDTTHDYRYLAERKRGVSVKHFRYDYNVVMTNLNSNNGEVINYTFSKGQIIEYRFFKSDYYLSGGMFFEEKQMNSNLVSYNSYNIHYDSVYAFKVNYYLKNFSDSSNIINYSDSVFLGKNVGIIGWKSKKFGNWFRK